MQGTTKEKEIAGPRGLKAQKKKHQEGKEIHGKRLKKNSQDPQQLPRGADPSRCISTVKRKIKIVRKKRTRKENKKQSKSH